MVVQVSPTFIVSSIQKEVVRYVAVTWFLEVSPWFLQVSETSHVFLDELTACRSQDKPPCKATPVVTAHEFVASEVGTMETDLVATLRTWARTGREQEILFFFETAQKHASDTVQTAVIRCFFSRRSRARRRKSFEKFPSASRTRTRFRERAGRSMSWPI